ncbi:MAG: lipopolysaccharide heptosyltransferase II [Variibacter sp.]|nr:lipopolysaccharide heptosyltransferase II [Variibacter sp.]
MDARLEDSLGRLAGGDAETSPILVVPYMWIGDFVRCHTVVRVLKARFPSRPVDVVATSLTAPLADYMPGVRQAVVADIPHRRLAIGQQAALARRLRREGYGTALVMSRKWKAALAPFLAGIPERIGYVGEGRFGLLNAPRWGERRLPRMVDQCAALALPAGAPLPPAWPPPRLAVPAAEIADWRARRGLGDEPSVVALAPGAVGPSKRWPVERYGAVASELARQGWTVWVIGGPAERPLAAEICAASGGLARDLTGEDLREAILALGAARLAISNDSGLLHVAAAIGTPTIGIFGPTSAWHWAPLNPLAGTVAAETPPPCQPCHKPVCRFGHHRCMRDIPAGQVLAAVRRALEPTSGTA